MKKSGKPSGSGLLSINEVGLALGDEPRRPSTLIEQLRSQQAALTLNEMEIYAKTGDLLAIVCDQVKEALQDTQEQQKDSDKFKGSAGQILTLLGSSQSPDLARAVEHLKTQSKLSITAGQAFWCFEHYFMRNCAVHSDIGKLFREKRAEDLGDYFKGLRQELPSRFRDAQFLGKHEDNFKWLVRFVRRQRVRRPDGGDGPYRIVPAPEKAGKAALPKPGSPPENRKRAASSIIKELSASMRRVKPRIEENPDKGEAFLREVHALEKKHFRPNGQ